MKNPFWIALVAGLGAVGVLASCGRSMTTVLLEQAKADAQDALADAHSERQRHAQIEQRLNRLLAEAQELKDKLEKSEKILDNVEAAVKKTDEDFTAYKEKYRASVLAKIPGLEIGPVHYQGKIYDKLAIRSIDGESLIVTGPAGVIELKTGDLPPSIVQMLGYSQSTAVQANLKAFLADFDAQVMKEKGMIPLGRPKPPPQPQVPEPMAPPVTRPNALDQELFKFVVVVDTDKEANTFNGFIARQGETTYFFTSASAIYGATSLNLVTTDGRRFTVSDDFDMADEEFAYDIARFRLGGTEIPALQLASAQDAVKPRDKVIAMGTGGGIPPVLTGSVISPMGFWLDLDPQLTSGHAGSAVLLDGTSKIVGIITKPEPASRLCSQMIGNVSINYSSAHACLRPDQITKWTHASLSHLAQESRVLLQISRENEIIECLGQISCSSSGIGGLNTDVLLAGGKSNIGAAIISEARQVDAYLNRGTLKVAPTTVRDLNERFLHGVQSAVSKIVLTVDPSDFCRFNQDTFRQLVEQRQKSLNALNEHFSAEIDKLRAGEGAVR